MNIRSQDGFSYIDVMIALVILMFGILSMMAALSFSLVQAAGHEQQLAAKQIATSTLESIMAVKETDPTRLGWPAVGNIGSNPDSAGVAQGIFSVGFQPVRENAGPDQIVGTPDDTGPTVSQLQRRIVITDVCDPDRPSPIICSPAGTLPVRMRSVTVTVTYNVGGLQRQEQVATVLTDYAVVN